MVISPQEILTFEPIYSRSISSYAFCYELRVVVEDEECLRSTSNAVYHAPRRLGLRALLKMSVSELAARTASCTAGRSEGPDRHMLVARAQAAKGVAAQTYAVRRKWEQLGEYCT